MQKFIFQISEAEEGERVDRYLSMAVDSLSRSYLQRLLKDGMVQLESSAGDLRPLKASYRVQSGERLRLDVPDAVLPEVKAEEIALDVLFEDDHLLVINKPKGMVVHPAPGHYSGTLVNALLWHCRDSLSGINGVLRPGIVHRIDRDTTGALLVCKNDFAHQEIASQLKAHRIERRYAAIVCGVIANDSGTINAPIGRNPKDRKKMAVLPISHDSGREAITHFKVVERFHKYSLIECMLETGRTHQIRVHMTHLGFPLLGDSVYGNIKVPFKLDGQSLHAKTLGFIHPVTKEKIKIEAPLPEYFLRLLKSMER